MLPKEVPVSLGDAVLVGGMATELFATVAVIERTETGSFQNVHFSHPINLLTLQFVEIRAPAREASSNENYAR